MRQFPQIGTPKPLSKVKKTLEIRECTTLEELSECLNLQREVFVLRVTEGMAYADIPRTVGSTEGACRVHYHNAMRAVKEFLDET